MKSVIYKKGKAPVGAIIIGIYIMIIFFAAAAFDTYGIQSCFEKTVYAMADYETASSEVYVYVRTLGGNVIESLNISEGIANDAVNQSHSEQNMINTMIMKQQNTEHQIESELKMYKPHKKDDSLKTVFRDSFEISKDDIKIMQRIVEAEAGGEDVSGRMIVANVVLNRMCCKRFPDTVEGVVFANNGHTYQFSPIADGRYYSVKVSEKTKEAVKRAINGEDNSSGAEYFLSRKLADSDNVKWFDTRLKYLFKHGCHEFFKK